MVVERASTVEQVVKGAVLVETEAGPVSLAAVKVLEVGLQVLEAVQL